MVNPKTPDEPAVNVKPAGETEPAGEVELARQNNLVSPARGSTPIMEERENPTSELPLETTYPDVMITWEKHSTPKISNVLVKIPAKDESPMKKKGKTKLQFQSLEDLDVNSLHQGYLTRLSERRDTGIAMVNTLK